MMLEIESNLGEFWNVVVIRSMLSCLDCLVTGSFALLSCLVLVSGGLVQRGNVHSFDFSSTGLCGIMLLLY